MVTWDDSATAAAPRSAPAPRLTARQRRSSIEGAAARLFARNGYDATTVEQIVSEAGVSKPMLYRHFESKKDLCMMLLERRRDELAAAPLDQFIGSDDSPPERLPAMIDAWFAHVQQNPDSCRMLFQDVTFDGDIRALQLELRARQRAADIALVRELGVRVPEAQLDPLAEIIRSSLTGLALWWLDNPAVPRAAPVAAMLRMTRGLFYASDD
jgi:AcrR family transcriptional regulator